MAAENYSACLVFVLRWEGGKVNHPKDPGGKTNQGITQRTYDAYRKRKLAPPRDVYSMADFERDEIYRTLYWDVIGGDKLPAGVDLATFDVAVNSGPAKARYFLGRAMAGSPKPGIIVRRMCDDRLNWLRKLKRWPTFGNGWRRRVVACEALGIGMAVADDNPEPSAKAPSGIMDRMKMAIGGGH